MTGFINRLFGSKDRNESKEATPPKAKPARPQHQGSTFFLDEDEARSLGNADYIRRADKIKRTFPESKGSGSKGFSTEYEVSSLEKRRAEQRLEEAKSSNSASFGSAQTPKENPAESRRQADSSMDMFRNMARDLRK